MTEMAMLRHHVFVDSSRSQDDNPFVDRPKHLLTLWLCCCILVVVVANEGFPPRLAHQPIFYPVTNAEYARQIARDWNTVDEKSGFAGFVTAFELDENYLSNFEPHIVGSSKHVEYWIPAESLSAFNDALRGLIRLENGFFGAAFTGHVPDAFGLKGKDAIAQFVALHKSWDYSKFDVACEISANRKTVFLNWLFWSSHDFSTFGISQQQRELLLGHLKRCWELNHIEVPLPLTIK